MNENADQLNWAKPQVQAPPPGTSARATLQCSETGAPVTIGTTFELDKALHAAELQCVPLHPIIASLYAHGHWLQIGLGLPDSFVSFQRFEPTPGPGFITVGNGRANHRAVFFFLGWRHTEIPSRNLLPASKARQVIREFFDAGTRSMMVDWETL